MSDIGLENGYTRIANEILEVLAITDLNGTQRRILDIIFRQTYGYQRKEHDLSISFIAKATNINKKQIQRELTTLIDRNIISVVSEASFSKSRKLTFNKNYTGWLIRREVANKLPPNEIDTHTGNELVTSTGSELVTQIKKKETIKERPYEIFFNNLWSLYPNKKGKTKISAKQKKKLLDEVGEEKLKAAILKYSSEVTDREPKYIMHGSTFFNSGYEDYLVVQAKELEVKPTGKIRIMSDEDIEEYNRNLEVKLQQGVD